MVRRERRRQEGSCTRMGEPLLPKSLPRWTWGSARLSGSPWSAFDLTFTFICLTASLAFLKFSCVLPVQGKTCGGGWRWWEWGGRSCAWATWLRLKTLKHIGHHGDVWWAGEQSNLISPIIIWLFMAGQSGVASSARPILRCVEGESDEQGKQNQVNHSQVGFNSEKCPQFWMEEIRFPCQNIPKHFMKHLFMKSQIPCQKHFFCVRADNSFFDNDD